MQRNLSTGFEDSYRRHLVTEQRKAVLETIARELSPTTTLGDIVDAAQELGWGDAMGELSLGEFALALFGDRPAPVQARPEPAAPEVALVDEDEDQDEAEADADADVAVLDDDDDLTETEVDILEAAPEPVLEDTPRRKKKKKAKAKAKAASKKIAKAGGSSGRVVPAQAALPNVLSAASKRAAAAAPVAAPAKKLSKKAAKKAAMYVAEMDDDSEAMNLDQAARLLIPLVKRLKEATMHDLEENTGMGRRKLRFHIGQLVKHGRLKRHGMGRGTCYTVR